MDIKVYMQRCRTDVPEQCFPTSSQFEAHEYANTNQCHNAWTVIDNLYLNVCDTDH
jgi:hypothetical protein